MDGKTRVRRSGLSAAGFLIAAAFSYLHAAGVHRIARDVLLDKIRGGWAGQAIGCTFGGPTEFRFKGTFIPDYQPIAWSEKSIPWAFEHSPGLYDDVYMDLTFVEVMEKHGIDAPPASFAKAFAGASYPLWHANQTARYNILNGILPPGSGHWLNNPHADDIDFQIEADFAGLMAPALVNAASEICDRVGHIMNSGDGWYGGVYIAAMYSLAFIRDDPATIVEEALQAVPAASLFSQTIRDVILWHKQNPSDWKETWFKVQKKWSEDVGCPDGVFTSFNIDAKINSAWVVLGLLYGEGDFGRTLSISARCGDDSDCNPASAGGILGTMLGYSGIPDSWKAGLADVENKSFPGTALSLKDASGLSFKHALELIKKNRGTVDDKGVIIRPGPVRPVKLEKNFEGHHPNEKRSLGFELRSEWVFSFEGIGFVVNGEAMKRNPGGEHTFQLEVAVDQKSEGVTACPTEMRVRKNTLAWKYQMRPGKHSVRLRVRNPSEKAALYLQDLVIYSDRPGGQTR